MFICSSGIVCKMLINANNSFEWLIKLIIVNLSHLIIML